MVEIHAGDNVLVEFSTFGDRFLSVVTDVLDDGRLRIYSPMPKLVLDRLRTDRKVVVRYAQEGKLVAFKSHILNHVHTAETLLLLEEPGSIFDAEERSEPRCSCSFPATLINGKRAAQAVVEDMSRSCTRIRFINGDIPFLDEVGGEVRLTFRPFEEGDVQNVNCWVKSLFTRSGDRYAVLEFDANETGARDRIGKFIETQICCCIPRL
jgi:hypothetical protein